MTDAALDLGGGPSTTFGGITAPDGAGGSWLIAGTRDGSAELWSSPDALRWTATALGAGEAQALAASGALTVVVGSVGSGPDRRAAVWTSTRPGTPPTAVPDVTAFGGHGTPAEMDAVAAGTIGVFAAGTLGGRPTIWYSSNGVAWSVATQADRLLDQAPGAVVNALTVDPNGAVAIGTVRSGSHTDGALWASADGIRWHTDQPTGSPFADAGDHLLTGAVWTGTSLVAAGGVRSGPEWAPATWMAPGGSSWGQADQALPVPDAAGSPTVTAGGSIVRGIAESGATAGPPGSAAPALAAVGGSSGSQAVWTSNDGVNWSDLPLPAAAQRAGWTADLVATDGRTVVVADSEPGQDHLLVHTPAGWREPTGGPGPWSSPRPTAEPVGTARLGATTYLAVDVDQPGRTVGSGGSEAVLLSSIDGTTWQVAGRLPGARLTSLIAVGGGLVAGGLDGASSVTWSSTDGTSWGRPQPLPGATGPVVATATPGGALVAVASTAPGGAPLAGAWTSTSTRSPVWSGPTLLDRQVSLAQELPVGACATTAGLVAVGSASRAEAPSTSAADLAGGVQPNDGWQAAAWAAGVTGAATGAGAPPTGWVAATVTPQPAPGDDTAALGCTTVPGATLAWGGTDLPSPQQSSTTVPGPALWRSSDGRSWTQLSTSGLAGAAPLAAVAGRSTLVAVAGGLPAALASPDDPARAEPDPVVTAATEAPVTDPAGGATIWRSTDGGRSWERVPASGGPAGARSGAATAAVDGALGIAAGTVDGQLAVWAATP